MDRWPTIRQYEDALLMAHETVGDQQLSEMEVVRRGGRDSVPRGLRGHTGAVFQFVDRTSSKAFAFKVYLSNSPGLRERQERISAHLSQLRDSSCLVNLKYLHEGIYVAQGWYPAVKMEWTPGSQLDSYLRRPPDEVDAEQLVVGWIDVLRQLREGQILHGDLQFGNVLVEQPAQIRLVDYDAMWVPGLDDTAPAPERGHEAFQHPTRTTGQAPRHTETLEDFSALVVLTDLLCALDGQWPNFELGEGLAIRGEDLRSPEGSEVLKQFANSAAPLGTVTRLLLNALANVEDASAALAGATAELGLSLPLRQRAPGPAGAPTATFAFAGSGRWSPPATERVKGAPRLAPVDPGVLAAVAGGRYHAPHSVLGAHPHDGAVTVRTLRPLARSVEVALADGSRYPLTHDRDDVWAGVLPIDQVQDYRLRVSFDSGPAVVDDPYRHLPTIGEVDLQRIGEGRHEELWTVLGARVRRFDGPLGEVTGVSFVVWAPNAHAVRVMGDFNDWAGRGHAMRSLGATGVWELFVPGVSADTRYKFEILGPDDTWREKADPMAFGTEVPPSNASVVVESRYAWQDGAWTAARTAGDVHAGPMSIYEVHLGSWRQGLSYRDLADQLVAYVGDLGFTHVELMPVAEHPYGGSWGYQVTSYYAPTSRFGHPDEFRYLVDTLHQAGIGVILDWVPAHFPKDEWALARFDGGPLYEYADTRRGEHPEWGTLVFDYGRNEVRNFLVANALYWLEEYHIDGLRVHAVASMLYLDYARKDGEWAPNRYGGREHLEAISFLQEVNATAYRRVPGIVTIAEESAAWPGVTRPTHLGGLGFGLKWNTGWTHDSLDYVANDPIQRQYHHNQMTFSLMYAFSEKFVLPISHDEVVHGRGSLLHKMPGDRWQQLATLRAYLAFMWAHPGKQQLFMGSELGQEAEWAESRELDWSLEDAPGHAGLQQLVRDLNRVYRDHPELWERDADPGGFEWIDANDAERNTFSFLRFDKQGRPLACIVNFAGVAHENYRVGLPSAGRWEEVLNTDSEVYGGSGVGNLGAVTAVAEPWQQRLASITLRIPPLGAVWLTPAKSPVEGLPLDPPVPI